jgi:hypothetical protein
MRSLSLLSLLLIAIWSLSPLGGQASLRIIGSTVHTSNTTRPLQYVNTSSDILQAEYEGGEAWSQYLPSKTLFGAAMLGSSSSTSLSIDTWGNLKVPWIESLDPSTADTEGWYPIPQLNSSDDFISLLGVPLSMITLASNLTTSFSIQTSYWTLSCPSIQNLGNGSNETEPGPQDDASQARLTAKLIQLADPSQIVLQNITADAPQNLYLYSISTHTASEPWDSPNNTGLRQFTYLDENNEYGDWAAASCTIKTTHVEVSAFCSSDNCTAVEIRHSRQTHAPESWTSFDVADGAFYWFATPFIEALVTGMIATPTPYQKFIINPLHPFSESFDIPCVSVVPNATFALRLGQLFNTYWMAMLAPTAIPKGLRNSNLTADTADIKGTLQSSTTAIERRKIVVLKCNMVWFAVLLLSSTITAFIGLCGLIAALCRLGPDIGFNISSLVKDSPFVDQTSVATTLGGTDRSRLMRNWYAKFGDVAAEEEVGHIAIGSGNVGDLQRGRLYR